MKLSRKFNKLNFFRITLAAGAVGAGVVGLLVIMRMTSVFSFRPYVRYQAPSFPTFSELKMLSERGSLTGRHKRKLERFWRTPIVSNEAYYRGARPRELKDSKLGRCLRVASWNIEKSYHVPEAIRLMTSEEAFRAMVDTKRAAPESETYRNLLRQRERLRTADVLILQEMDIGVKRSGYLNAARELAQALNMNYAYGAEQLEVDPVYLGLEKVRYEDGSVDEDASRYYAADPAQYKGVFGSAVLSRYPIKSVKVFQLKNQAYDWYRGEKNKFGFLEKSRRIGSEIVFKNQITREMKTGGRIFFRVDLDVPGLPRNTLTVINIHLEIKCLPKGREKQIEEILSYIGGIRNPVVMAGDFNSAPDDLSATSVWRVAERAAKNPSTWFSAATAAVLPFSLAINMTRFASNVTKNLQNPTGTNIPVLAQNPVKPMFDRIKQFRFKDKGAFDFRGDKPRTINGRSGELANSNERDFKSYKTTFSVKRPLAVIIGKYRLDWFFVKSFLRDPRGLAGPYRFAPHFGETLEELNTHLITPISDHHPNVIDLPFEEPRI